MVDRIVAGSGTKTAQSYVLPFSASRLFGLKSDYLSLFHCLTREFAEIQVELLKMVRDSIDLAMLGAIADVLRDMGYVKMEVI